MPYDAELADPLADVRDVVESFRSFGIAPADWRRTLADAATTLDRLRTEQTIRAYLPDLLQNLRILLSSSLASDRRILDEVADQVAATLSQTKVPGIPNPEEDDWGFGEITAS